MEQIYPLTEEAISRCRGMLVCVVFKNGMRQIGVLESCHNGAIELDDNPFGYGRRQSHAEAAPQIPSPPSINETLKKTAGSRKSKKTKAAGATKGNQSSTNSAPQPENPASLKTSATPANPAKIPLNDIAFLLLMI